MPEAVGGAVPKNDFAPNEKPKVRTHSRFIATDPMGKLSERGEDDIWVSLKESFSKRDVIGYWRYPVFGMLGENRTEPDFLIADRKMGICVINVLGADIGSFESVNGPEWKMGTYAYSRTKSPFQMAEDQVYALGGRFNAESTLRQIVQQRAMIALPSISEAEWKERGFDKSFDSGHILFKEHLTKTRLALRVSEAPDISAGGMLDKDQWTLLTALLGNNQVFRKPEPKTECKPGSKAELLSKIRGLLHGMDLQQEHIGKSIAPGPQRIRGIAGSGKTVMLAQKAAHMHLKYPDWDIAFVFYTRSLYETVIEQIDKWVKAFSGGRQSFKPSPDCKLKILHAWGGRNQPGLYSMLAEAAGLKPLTVGDTKKKGFDGTDGLAYAAHELLENKNVPNLFDAVLIDEGQDLLTDEKSLLVDGKQPIYWLAISALRPAATRGGKTRRLVWAYDEAQSLDSLKIPTARELFGDSLANLVRGSYHGGIRKSEVMHKCYRTPGPVLVAAHALGMGLNRDRGMLTGITNKDGWKSIGYEVEGDFRKANEIIRLTRPLENSPNPVPQLSPEPVISFQPHTDRKSELEVLVDNILDDFESGLQPSRDILIVCVGDSRQSYKTRTSVCKALEAAGIDFYAPSALGLNYAYPKFPNNDPNKFWMEGGVTVATIERAKGNEADQVYIVGMDNIAKFDDEADKAAPGELIPAKVSKAKKSKSKKKGAKKPALKVEEKPRTYSDVQLQLRNQLFVALTRARAWVKISGVGDYPMFSEIKRVLEQGNVLYFVNKKPKRELESD